MLMVGATPLPSHAPVSAAVAVTHDRAEQLLLGSRSRVDKRIDAIPDAAFATTSAEALVDPLRVHVTERIAGRRRPLFFAWAFAQILFGVWLWRSGLSAHIRDAVASRLSSRIFSRAGYIAIVSLLAAVLALPFNAVTYRTFVDVGVSHQSPMSWLGDFVLANCLQTLLISIVLVAILECVDRSRVWYLWSTAIVFVGSAVLLIVDPIFIEPLFHPAQLLNPQSALGQRLYEIEARANVGRIPIYISALSRTSEVGNANVSGMGPARRVTIGDTLLRTATPREVAFVMAHELGHESHHDPIRITLLGDLLVLLAGAVAVVVSDRIPLRRDDDGVSRLPLVAALFGVCTLILFPLGNRYSSYVEARADAFGLKVSQDPVAAARVFIRFADEGFSPVCPPRLVRMYFYDHPPIGSRVAKAMKQPDPCP
jgi:STE24 endopeptidase